ncbi:tetratricopeptide repeat protein [Solemya velesiana gill symbiont]|uniref:tetratricopeptide repeat protein n=1 Tax=Solemya velesiana gill symbiont TaxID=1918948 RepID=UPI001082AC67|nr:tetratricopeptide repeat protein [Solemya velesiana gill symbiont]
MARVSELFRTRDYLGFDYLLTMLGQYPEEMAFPYLCITQGMKAELEGDPGQAVKHYHAVLDNIESPVIEFALKRIAHICMNAGDMENAVYAVDSLVHISDRYVPFFANLLTSIGQPEDAIALYEQYTGQHPGDMGSVEKLAVLYHKLGRQDDIVPLLQSVEQLAPGSEMLGRLKLLCSSSLP